MGNRATCCFRKDVDNNLEFKPERNEFINKVKSKANFNKISKIQSNWRGHNIRENYKSKLKLCNVKSKSYGSTCLMLEDVRPGVRELQPEENIPILHIKVLEILTNIGPFMIEEKEIYLINNPNLIKKGPVMLENNIIYKGT